MTVTWSNKVIAGEFSHELEHLTRKYALEQKGKKLVGIMLQPEFMEVIYAKNKVKK